MAKEQPEFEEIDLRDYFEVLSKRKGIILGIYHSGNIFCNSYFWGEFKSKL